MPRSMVLPPEIERDLVGIVGSSHVLTDPGVRAGFERDWTGRFGGPSLGVVRPASAREVAAVLATCASRGVRVVLQGGNTGLVGGGVPSDGELVVSLRRLARVGPADPGSKRLTVEAGATLSSAASAAGVADLQLGIDLAARDAATIGGMVATDAGGLHAIAYGTMGDQVLALEAARADGRHGPVDAAELRDLVGSEGTLAAITAVTLRLVPRHPAVAVALVALESVGAAVALVRDARGRLPGLTAAELVLADGLALTARHLGVAEPFAPLPPAAVLLECRAATDPLDALAAVLAAASGVGDVLVGLDAADRRRLWALREAHSEAISTLGIPHKLDVVVPDDVLATFLDRAGQVARAAARGARVIVYGHLGVGDVHVNVIGPAPDDERVDDAILGLVDELGGDVAGEHGAGIAKARWIERTRDARERAAIDARKAAWDPARVLGPGVIPAARIREARQPTHSPTIER